MNIPFRLTLISLDTELSEPHIRSAFAVRLVRSTFLTIAKQRVRIERVIATGAVWKVEKTIGDGTPLWEITGSLVGAKPGGETSWGLLGFMEVRVSTEKPFALFVRLIPSFSLKYSVRMTFNSVGSLPKYSCEEYVQMVTDEATDEFDLDEARERPALGLIDQQVGARPPAYFRA